MKTSGMIPLLSVLLVINAASAQPDASTSAQGGAVQPATATPEVSLSDTELFEIMGELIAFYYSGASDMDISDEEKQAVAKGFTRGLNLKQLSEKTKNGARDVQMMMGMRRIERNQRLSDINKSSSAEFIKGLDREKVRFTDSGLGYEILEPGSDKTAQLEDVVQVTYEGKLIDGTVFDSNLDESNPVSFPLGGVIPGFSQGLQLVGEGGKIRLYIPSDLGYGDNPPGGVIEAGSLLVFEVKLHKIVNDLDRPIPMPAPMPDAVLPQ